MSNEQSESGTQIHAPETGFAPVVNHTPGPWEWKEVPLPGLGDDRWCEVLIAKTGLPVVRHESSGDPTPWRIKAANARLIAAAPAMLKALRQIGERKCHCNQFNDDYECSHEVALGVLGLTRQELLAQARPSVAGQEAGS